MKNSKVSGFFSKGRKWVFTLALFLLVFAVASVVKIQAAGNVTGWLWGGTEEVSDGNPNNGASGYETGVGWVSMSGTTYGVSIPSGNGPATGYAWMNAGGNPDNLQQNGIGWLDFDPQDHCGSAYGAASCNAPDGSGVNAKGGVRREGNNLVGWARIVEIAKASASGNSGGWTGWVKFSNSYGGGIDVNKMDGTGSNKMYAWSGNDSSAGELGWIDFSRASYTVSGTLTVSGTTLSNTSSGRCRPIYATLADNSGTKTITFDASGSVAV